MEIVKGVHQLKLPFPGDILADINVYVIEGNDGCIMIDSGWGNQESFEALGEGLKADRLRLGDIKTIVITHIHPDHYGLASKIKQLSGAKIAMERVETGLINSRYKDFTELLKKVEEEVKRNGVPYAELPDYRDASVWMNQFVAPELPDVLLDDGDRFSNGLFELQVIKTPGHSMGHICLYESRKRLLFSGDHVLYDTTPHVGFNPQSGSNPVGDYISSLQKLKKFNVSFVLPGHGPVFNSLDLRIDQIINHHEKRKREIMRALDRGSQRSAYQIAQEITWMAEEGGVAFKDLAPWNRRLAVMETVAHLRLLASEGKVSSVDMNGVSIYVATD